MNQNTIIADIGNSFIKIKHNDTVNSIYINELVIDNIKKIIDITTIHTAVIASVNNEMGQLLVNFFADNNITVILDDSLLRQQNIIDFHNIEGMGNDRKLGLLGALTFYQTPIITIDCGTAITVNILDTNCICKGGIIMCGVGTQTKALSEYAPGLPIVKVNKENHGIINNTENAINTGIISAVRGGIVDFIYSIIFKEKLDNTNVIFTGGYGDLVFKLCAKSIYKINSKSQKTRYMNNFKILKVEVKKNLVFYGLEKLLIETVCE